MLTVKVGPELVEVATMGYRANQPMLLQGKTGVGKSEALKQAADGLGIAYICRDLSMLEPVDLAGLPVIANSKLTYAAPGFLPTNGRGLFVMEELNRAPQPTRSPCLQLLSARCLNDYTLPPGWLPVAAVNPDDGEYDVDALDPALLARFMTINVVADVECWIRWAEEHGVHPTVLKFVRATPRIFDAPGSNPRAWFYASKIVRECESRKYSPLVLLAGIAGVTNEKLAHAFVKYYHSNGADDVATPDQLLRRYGRFRQTVQAWIKSGNTAVLESITTQLLLHLQVPEKERQVKANATALKNLAALRGDLPAEFRSRLDRHLPWLTKGVR
jgi:hypothetical protein